MSEIIYGIDMNNSTSKYVPKKQYCKQTGEMCELAVDFGYCKITACIKKNCGADIKDPSFTIPTEIIESVIGYDD